MHKDLKTYSELEAVCKIIGSIEHNSLPRKDREQFKYSSWNTDRLGGM
jgi:hypothetical protein